MPIHADSDIFCDDPVDRNCLARRRPDRCGPLGNRFESASLIDRFESLHRMPFTPIQKQYGCDAAMTSVQMDLSRQGHPKIAHRFNGGLTEPRGTSSPRGATDRFRSDPPQRTHSWRSFRSFVPDGTHVRTASHQPTVETVGYFRLSLRDKSSHHPSFTDRQSLSHPARLDIDGGQSLLDCRRAAM